MTSYDTRRMAALWAAVMVAVSVQAGAAGPGGSHLQVRSVQVDGRGDGRLVTVSLSTPTTGVRRFALSNPPRVVMDLAGPVNDQPAPETRFPVDDAIVRGVRTAPFEGRLRVVLDLRRDVRLNDVTTTADGVVARLGTPELEPVASAPAPTAASATTSAMASTRETPSAPVATTKTSPMPAEPGPTGTARARTADTPTISPLIRGALGDTLDRPVPPRPSHVSRREPERPRLMAVTPAPAPAAAPSSPTSTKSFKGQRISLDFKDADIQNVLRVLADVSGLNIIATDDVKGKVTLHLNDVPWDQAFDLILRTNRLESIQEANVVRISTVERLTEEREQLLAAEQAQRIIEPLQVRYVRVNYARADEELIDKVRGVLTERGSVTFDDRTNTVIVRDIDRGIRDARRLVSQLDVQSPQVLIEANIVEATEDFARGLGVQWGYRFEAGPATGNPTGMNFPGTVGLGGSGLGLGSSPPSSGTGAPSTGVPFLADFPVPGSFASGFGPGTGSALDLALGSLDGAHSLSARLTALEETGKGRVVSRPRVITMNNVAATIQSLTILRVKLPSTGTVINTGQGGAAGAASTATEKINTGITLVVTPQVSSDGYVLMSIFAKSSQPDFTRAVDGIPNEISREANSNVLVRSGETVVLGGIYRQVVDDNEAGLPYLRGIPGLGWLFKRQLKTERKEELLVFLTPKILDTGTASLPPAERLWSSRPKG